MYKHNTLSQVLKLLDRNIVTKSIEKHNSDKHSKGFGTWNHLVAMIFSQLSDCKSLRDLEIRFNAKSQNHYHLRSKALKKSTLADANQNRDSGVFRDIAAQLIIGQGKEIKDVVSLIDSSIIRISGRGSGWAEETKTGHGKGLKLHIQCGGSSKSIEAVSISNTNVNDITAAKEFDLEAGKIYVFDKGYFDFNWWNRIACIDSYFVTRIKKNTAYKVIEEKSIESCSENIVSDKVIELTNKSPRGGKRNSLAGKSLRLVEVYSNENKKRYQFITNLMDKEADEISLYYKQRWGIELLFKWFKQNLKITKFLSESENAAKTQLYVAIIVYILIDMFKKMCGDVFKRNIDLISWMKIAISSSNTPLTPNLKQRSKDAICQLSLGDL
jgi:hypothetical protein